MNFGIHSSSFSFVVRQGPHSRHTRTRTCTRAYFARHAARARARRGGVRSRSARSSGGTGSPPTPVPAGIASAMPAVLHQRL